jgi:hypothetical protein
MDADDLARFLREVRHSRAALEESTEALLCNRPSRAVWWDGLEETRVAAERLMEACDTVRDSA